MLVLGPHHKDRKSARDITNIGNPKVNRGCPPTQPTAPQQTVWKIHLDLQCHILHWGSTIPSASTLSGSDQDGTHNNSRDDYNHLAHILACHHWNCATNHWEKYHILHFQWNYTLICFVRMCQAIISIRVCLSRKQQQLKKNTQKNHCFIPRNLLDINHKEKCVRWFCFLFLTWFSPETNELIFHRT